MVKVWKAVDAASATLTGVDRYGFEMSAVTADGPRPVRLAFSQLVKTPEEVRNALIEKLKAARSALGEK